MNKRIKAKVAKRRANSPRMVELRRWLLELATAKRELDTARNSPPFLDAAARRRAGYTPDKARKGFVANPAYKPRSKPL